MKSKFAFIEGTRYYEQDPILFPDAVSIYDPNRIASTVGTSGKSSAPTYLFTLPPPPAGHHTYPNVAAPTQPLVTLIGEAILASKRSWLTTEEIKQYLRIV